MLCCERSALADKNYHSWIWKELGSWERSGTIYLIVSVKLYLKVKPFLTLDTRLRNVVELSKNQNVKRAENEILTWDNEVQQITWWRKEKEKRTVFFVRFYEKRFDHSRSVGWEGGAISLKTRELLKNLQHALEVHPLPQRRRKLWHTCVAATIQFKKNVMAQ